MIIEYGKIDEVCLYINTNPVSAKSNCRLNVRHLIPVNTSEGIVSIDNPITEKYMSDDTKLYIVKYIGTLEEIRDNSQQEYIHGKDTTKYGTIHDVCLYKNASLEKFKEISHNITNSESPKFASARKVLLEKNMERLIKSYLAKGRKTKNRKSKKSKKSKKTKRQKYI